MKCNAIVKFKDLKLEGIEGETVEACRQLAEQFATIKYGDIVMSIRCCENVD
jgi:hypothetical protein